MKTYLHRPEVTTEPPTLKDILSMVEVLERNRVRPFPDGTYRFDHGSPKDRRWIPRSYQDPWENPFR